MSAAFERGAVVLGAVGVVASWQRPSPENSRRWQPMLVIMECSATDEGAHTPSASISLNSTEAILALRAAIDEALKGAPT